MTASNYAVGLRTVDNVTKLLLSFALLPLLVPANSRAAAERATPSAADIGVGAGAPVEASEVGRVLTVRGKVLLLLPAQSDEQGVELTRGSIIPKQATVAAMADSSARLLMKDGSVLVIGPQSRINFNRYDVAPSSRRVSMRVILGRLWARVSEVVGDESREYEIQGANAVAGVRGTDLIVDVGDAKGDTRITCVTGKVEVRSSLSDDHTMITPGQSSTVGAGGNIVTITLTASQLREIVAVAAARSTLDSGGAGRRVEQVAPTGSPTPNDGQGGGGGSGDTGGGSGGSSPGDDDTSGSSPSGARPEGAAGSSGALDLEPGDGKTTRVHGRIDVRPR